MFVSTEEIVLSLIQNISSIDEVHSIGISGGKERYSVVGEGDIDIFIYCNKIPDIVEREAILVKMGDLLHDTKVNVFQDGHWGNGDFATINGVDTWLMYFTVDRTINEVESILNGEYPDKLDNYYYPVGRCAMLNSINVLYDKNSFLGSLKERLAHYPETLAEKLLQYHLDELDDREDLDRAVNRKDALFYHFALDIAIDHYLQALFAINRTYFPSRKRTLSFIEKFDVKPERCSERLLEVVRLGGFPEGLDESYNLLVEMIDDLKEQRFKIK